jgi:hypothetical protein
MKQIYYLSLVGCFFTFICVAQPKNPVKYRINKNSLRELFLKEQASYTYLTGVDINNQENLINFNPILLDYSKVSSVKVKQDIEELSNASFFTVYVSDIVLPEQELWNVKAANASINLTNKVVVNDKETIPFEGGKIDVPTLNSYTKTFDPKNKVNNATTFIELGNFSAKDNRGSKGVLAELLIYNSVLSTKTKQAVESALALKYGITLTNGKNYLASDKKVIFKVEGNALFVNRIAGIGKDASMELDQKQSHSTQPEGIVTIGVGEVYKTNQENKAIIEDQNFLVWGDNNGLLKESPVSDNSSLPLLQRQWLLQATGDKSTEIATEVQFNTATIFKDTNLDLKRYLLVIDKSGKGTFLQDNLQYITASKIEGNIISFKNVIWDTDKSGSDVFTFAISKDLETTLTEEKPEFCDFNNNGVLISKAIGGVAPYTFELKIGTQVLATWNSKENVFPDNKISKLGTANYTLSVTDFVGTKKDVSYLLTNPQPVVIDLGADKRFSFEQKEVELEGTISSTEQNLSYQWTSDKDFSSNLARVRITEPATYTLTVTTEKGCTTSDSIVVKPNYASSFIVYPNEAQNGEYDILIILTEPQDFTVQVFDATGKLISTSKVNNKAEYSIHGKKINAAGVYDVVVFNEKFKISRRLIVK